MLDPERDKKRLQSLLRKIAVIMILALYAGITFGNCVYLTKVDGETVLSDALDMFTEGGYLPNHLWPTDGGIVFLFVLAAVLLSLYMYLDYVKDLNTRRGEEDGSAKFNDMRGFVHDFIMSPKILAKFFPGRKYATKSASGGRKQCQKTRFSKDELAVCKDNSQLYSQHVGLSLDTRLTQLNLNAIVFGGSGAGKSRFFVYPNLLNANASYICTDPSGELMRGVGKYLENKGYEIRCLNLQDMSKSCRYNPMAYVHEDSDLLPMIKALVDNIEGPKKGGSGDNKFWDETSQTLLSALCGYLFETQPIEKRNFNNVLRLLSMANVSDDKKSTEKDDLDKLFDELEAANPQSYAVSQWKVIKSAGTGKTAQNIIISTQAIFARFFMLDKIANLTYKDEMNLEDVGRKRVAIFIVTPQGDTTYNFLASLLYTQLFDILYKQGEKNASERGTTSVELDQHVSFYIDEAANVGVIPGFSEKISTCRKYGISICPIYQNQSQVKGLFKDNWESIAGNCDSMLFLGGIDGSTVKLVSDRLGKQTINTKSHSVSKGKGGGSTSTSTKGRELLTTTEIEQMPNNKCICFIRSMKPFFDFKYPLEEHPHYKESGIGNPEMAFIAPWHLEYDRKLMNEIAVKKVGEEGYIKPQRADWVTDEDEERIKKEQDSASIPGFIEDPRPMMEALEGKTKLKLAPEIANGTAYEDASEFSPILINNLSSSPLGQLLLNKLQEQNPGMGVDDHPYEGGTDNSEED